MVSWYWLRTRNRGACGCSSLIACGQVGEWGGGVTRGAGRPQVGVGSGC